MQATRVLVLAGVLVALVSTIFLSISASALVRVFGVVAGEPGNGLLEDLNVTLWASLGLGSGLICVIVGLAQAQGRCAIGRVAQAAIVGSGFVMILAAAMLATGMQGLRDDFTVIAHANVAPNADSVKSMIETATHRVSAGMVALLNAMILLAISIWQMFWAQPGDLHRSRFVRPVLIGSLISLVLFMLFQGWAVWAGHGALGMAAGEEAAKPSDIAGELTTMLACSNFASGGLLMSGILLITLVALFDVHRDTIETKPSR